MDIEEFIKYLRSTIRASGTQKEWAIYIGVSESYLSDVINGNRDPGNSILDALGFERVVTYRRKIGGDAGEA